MTWQLQFVASVGDLRPVYPHDRHVAIEEVSDIGVVAVRRKGDALGKPADLDLVAYFRHLRVPADRDHRFQAIVITRSRAS